MFKSLKKHDLTYLIQKPIKAINMCTFVCVYVYFKACNIHIQPCSFHWKVQGSNLKNSQYKLTQFLRIVIQVCKELCKTFSFFCNASSVGLFDKANWRSHCEKLNSYSQPLGSHYTTVIQCSLLQKKLNKRKD